MDNLSMNVNDSKLNNSKQNDLLNDKNENMNKNNIIEVLETEESEEELFIENKNKYCALHMKAPYFECDAYDGENIRIKLNDFKNKWIVILFYPLDFTFICPTEICGLNDLYDDFKSLNCEVLACLVDSILNHTFFFNKLKSEGGLFPCSIKLMSDPLRRIATDYGVLITEGINRNQALRATFIIDDKQIIKSIDINDNNVGRNIEDILRRVKDLQGIKSEF